jgi:hypothetical protein
MFAVLEGFLLLRCAGLLISKPNPRFQFQKRNQHFVRMHNEPLTKHRTHHRAACATPGEVKIVAAYYSFDTGRSNCSSKMAENNHPEPQPL